jgi:predicted transcriptional regulator YheO
MQLPASLAGYAPVAAAIAALLHPHGEVVLHDLGSGRIAAIWNAVSERRAQDLSLLEDGAPADAAGPVLGPYIKTGPRGERLKSVTAVLPGADADSAPVGLLCINLDVSQLDKAAQLLSAFIAPLQDPPRALFSGDWREAAQARLHAWLGERGLSARALKRQERIELIAALDAQGLFEAKRAVEHVGEMIGASRAATYGYLTEARRRGASQTKDCT